MVGLALTACAAVLASCGDKPSASAMSDPATGTGQVASPGASVDDPAPIDKITVAGDSISVGLGTALRDAVDPDVTVKVIGEVGTGLARPDDFDWPSRLQELAADFPPDVLVFSLSSNDAQDLVDTDGKVVAPFSDEEAWDAEYSARLAASFDAFEDTDTSILWVGHVRTAKDKVGLTNRHIQTLAEQVAATRPWVTVSDLATMLGTGDTVAKSCLVADGLHLKTSCLDLAAHEILQSPPIA